VTLSGELEHQVRAELGMPPRRPGRLRAAVLTELTAACLAALRTAPSPQRATRLAGWIDALQTVADDLSEQELRTCAHRLAGCRSALRRLSALRTTAALIDGVCDELVGALGFARTMLARVEDGAWRPWKANRALLDEPWVPEWVDSAIPLDELVPETRLLRELRPALITNTAGPDVAAMVRAASVTSYVVAPIMPAGQVIGFLHADHGIGGRRCDPVDRDVLWAFAEGFGHIYERNLLNEQLQARRAQVQASLERLGDAVGRVANPAPGLAGDPDGSPPPPAGEPGAALRSALTPRETEVLDLVVAGARNGEIAERLAISLTTVKTHVRAIMVKSGASNRSQVIAACFGARDSEF
jgi:LuxR family transcriptional regulator, regulator of acetate metabolism